MSPQKTASAVFCIRVNGELSRVGFNDRREAEHAARGRLAPGVKVEVIDAVTGKIVTDLSKPD